MTREKKIVQTSVIGIIGNLLLVGAKALIGFLANSISIITDAVNNLSDALSSLITIIGTKLAGKKPDRKHPFGHGRVEYLTSIIISFVILAAGVMAIYESIQTLINQTKATYDYVSIIVIALAIVVKIALSLYFRYVGKKTNSEPLIASGKDAFFDALLSVATIIGIITSMFSDFNPEGYIGILIGCFIIKSGIEILWGGISKIVGERPEQELINKIKSIVCSFPEVYGAYDLIVNNYGHDKLIASIHVEVDDKLSAHEIHHLSRKIATKVYDETGAVITVGIYAKNEISDEVKEIKEFVAKTIQNNKDIRQLHGFYIDDDKNLITFDLVFDFKAKEPQKTIEELTLLLKEKYPNFNYYIIHDQDFDS